MNLRQVMEYYSRDDIQQAMLKVAKNRETVGVYRNGSFGARPNVILYPQDIEEMVKSGVVEFHTSLERWSNPMALKQGNYENLRTGWDLILDIDCKDFLHAKLTAVVLCKALKKHDISGISVKYTGGKGFHIGIPWESMPKTIDYKPTEKQYPELARWIGLYLKDFVREELGKMLLKRESPEEIAEKAGIELGALLTETGIDPFAAIEIDPVLISTRHLFRMPYSLNKKSFLVSLPIKPSEILDFEKEQARAEKVRARLGYLDDGRDGEASMLFAEAADWWSKQKKEEKKKVRRESIITKKVHPELFPPCIKNISEGLEDGRKRSVLILVNFLRSLKWRWDDIESYIMEWNFKNKPPLPENYIRGQLRWHRNRNKSVLPPNCDNPAYYKNFGMCKPDSLCRGIKNPVNYVIRNMESGNKKRGRHKAKARKK